MKHSKNIRVHYLQHVKSENLGNIEGWLKKRKYKITKTLLYKNQNLPGLNEFDWLIIMGGSMGVNEEGKYPWLKREKEFIKKSIKADKAILGICLGGQLMADCLGAKVKKNKHIEIGFYPVWLKKAGKKSWLFKGLATKLNLFHWHGDTFEIPKGCKNLAFSKACSNQAFTYGEKAAGVQFHFEYSLNYITENFKIRPKKLIKNKFVQDEKEILSQKARFEEINRIMNKIMSNIAGQL